jgi:hypothetical protein
MASFHNSAVMERYHSLVREVQALTARELAASAGFAMVGFLLVGTVTALWPNPWFVRMTPAAGFEVSLLAAQCLLGGLYLGIRASSCGVKSAGSGSVLGFLGVACPICNKVLLAIFGSGLLLTYFEPIRLYVGLLGTGILLFALYRKLGARATVALRAT